MNHTRRDAIRSRFNARKQAPSLGLIQARQIAMLNILERDGNPYAYFVLTCEDCPGSAIEPRDIALAKEFLTQHHGHSTHVRPKRGFVP